MLKYIQKLTPRMARVVFDAAILFIAISIVFNFIAYGKLTHIATDNQNNGRIVKAATGCGDTDSVQKCKNEIAARSREQINGYLGQADCWTRRALVNLPPPQSYTDACVYP